MQASRCKLCLIRREILIAPKGETEREKKKLKKK